MKVEEKIAEMKYKFALGLLLTICVSGVLYLMGSLSNVSFNIKEWTQYSRDIISILAGLLIFISWIVATTSTIKMEHDGCYRPTKDDLGEPPTGKI